LRKSDTASQLQNAFAGFDVTEEEYKAIYALQDVLEEKYPLGAISMALFGGTNMREYILARREAQKEVEAQIKETLGDSRYAEYVRGQRRDYQTLQAAAQRFNLSADTVTLTYQAREDAADGAKRISDDKSLDDAGKKEAYAALAARTTGQIRATLGDEVGDAYINNALVWLKNLPKGGTVKVDAQGNVDVSQPKPKSP
jgi:hypothetical protein